MFVYVVPSYSGDDLATSAADPGTAEARPTPQTSGCPGTKPQLQPITTNDQQKKTSLWNRLRAFTLNFSFQAVRNRILDEGFLVVRSTAMKWKFEDAMRFYSEHRGQGPINLLLCSLYSGLQFR